MLAWQHRKQSLDQTGGPIINLSIYRCTQMTQAKCRPALEMIINQYTQYTFSEQKFIRNEVALGFLGFLQLPGFLSPKSKGRRFRGGMPIAECHRISLNIIWIYHIFKIYKNLYLDRPNQWAHSVHIGPILYPYPLQTLAKASPQPSMETKCSTSADPVDPEDLWQKVSSQCSWHLSLKWPSALQHSMAWKKENSRFF